MNILGLSAFYHDSAAALLIDGKLIAAAQEERFSRKKHDSAFPAGAIQYCLEAGGLDISEVDAIAFYDKPFLKFERLIETYYAFAPKGIRSFIRSIPVWLREKIFLRKQLTDGLKEIGAYNSKNTKLFYPEHHLSHAASAFYPAPFEEAAILTVDGVGEWATASIAHGKGNSIKVLRELRFPHSLGLLYSAFTYFLGFRVNSGEYKLMGLAPYGNPDSERVQGFEALIREHLVDIRDDGSIWLNQAYFRYATGLRMAKDAKWEALFGFPRRAGESELRQEHCDLGLAIQRVTEDVVIKMAAAARELTGAKHLCMAGGVALNCVANGKLLRKGIFEDLFIQPAAGDAGGALGAALAVWHIHQEKERMPLEERDGMQGAYLGPDYSEKEILQAARRAGAQYRKIEDFSELAREAAALLAEGKVLGWFQGRMEFGPRALGNRSILGDPRNPEMQKRLNLKIKYRESFRPFAPSVLEEEAGRYFDLEPASPYMLLVADVAGPLRNALPEGYHQLPLKEKLYFSRSSIPAVTHIDFSARIQTVGKGENPRYWQLIEAFREQTGCGLLVNTSFNVRGEPIVCSPADALRCFYRTEMDYLVIGDFLFEKTAEQAQKAKKPAGEIPLD